MDLNVKVKMNSTNKILKDHGLENDGQAERFLRDTVDRFCDPYVPMNTGILKNTKIYPNNHSIKYTSPYAHYMYKGKVAVGASRPKGVKRTISNIPLKYQGAPKRGAEWDKRMTKDRKKDIERDLTRFIKGGN